MVQEKDKFLKWECAFLSEFVIPPFLETYPTAFNWYNKGWMSSNLSFHIQFVLLVHVIFLIQGIIWWFLEQYWLQMTTASYACLLAVVKNLWKKTKQT